MPHVTPDHAAQSERMKITRRIAPEKHRRAEIPRTAVAHQIFLALVSCWRTAPEMALSVKGNKV